MKNVIMYKPSEKTVSFIESVIGITIYHCDFRKRDMSAEKTAEIFNKNSKQLLIVNNLEMVSKIKNPFIISEQEEVKDTFVNSDYIINPKDLIVNDEKDHSLDAARIALTVSGVFSQPSEMTIEDKTIARGNDVYLVASSKLESFNLEDHSGLSKLVYKDLKRDAGDTINKTKTYQGNLIHIPLNIGFKAYWKMFAGIIERIDSKGNLVKNDAYLATKYAYDTFVSRVKYETIRTNALIQAAYIFSDKDIDVPNLKEVDVKKLIADFEKNRSNFDSFDSYLFVPTSIYRSFGPFSMTSLL